MKTKSKKTLRNIVLAGALLGGIFWNTNSCTRSCREYYSFVAENPVISEVNRVNQKIFCLKSSTKDLENFEAPVRISKFLSDNSEFYSDIDSYANTRKQDYISSYTKQITALTEQRDLLESIEEYTTIKPEYDSLSMKYFMTHLRAFFLNIGLPVGALYLLIKNKKQKNGTTK